jgi:transposase-like protein
MARVYSEAFVEQALVKVYSRGERTIASVAQELNMSYHGLKGLMRDKSKRERLGVAQAMGVDKVKDKRPQDWRPAEQLLALNQTHGLSEEQLHAWCRERGLFAHHLVAWQQSLTAPSASSAANQQELRVLKDENHQLKRELGRKEKALAEAAALLVLQKKFRALWEDEAK